MRTYGEITAADYEIHGNPFDFDPNEGRDLPATPAFVGAPATDKQLTFIRKLLAERGLEWTGVLPAREISKSEASAAISAMLDMPKAPRAAAKAPATVEITEGLYRNPETDEIFKVQRAVHGSGHLYAKRLVVEQAAPGEPATAYFEYAAGAIRTLAPEWKMDHEAAAAFGKLYGVCCSCTRPLTKEDSIHNGYGWKCASNHGWPYVKAPAIVVPGSTGHLVDSE